MECIEEGPMPSAWDNVKPGSLNQTACGAVKAGIDNTAIELEVWHYSYPRDLCIKHDH